MKKIPKGLRNSPNKANSDLFLNLIAFSFIIPVFPKVPKNMKNFFTPNSYTSLVLWNSASLGSTLGLPKFTVFLRGITGIPWNISSMGLMPQGLRPWAAG